MANPQLTSFSIDSKHGALHLDSHGHDFNGQDDFIQLPSTWGGPGWEETTVTAWIRPTANTGDFQAILSPGDTRFVHFQLHNAGVGNITAYTDQGAVVLPVIPVEPLNQWRHVTLIIKSGASKLLVDGEQVGATQTKTFNHITASDEVCVGRGHGQGRYFKGQIAGLSIWHAAHKHEDIHSDLYKHLHADDKPTLEVVETPTSTTAGFRSHHGKYISAQPDGRIECNRGHKKGWETFTLEYKGDKVGFKGSHGKYVSAQPDGSLTCDRGQLKSWELFTVEEKGGKVGFKGAHGKYISAQPDGTIVCDRGHLQGWELFTQE